MHTHVLFDLIGSLRASLHDAMLEGGGLDEQLHVDVLLGDLTYETSASLPGESSPPHVRADISLEWSTWAQSAYRSWALGEGLEDTIDVVIEVALRVGGLGDAEVSPAAFRASLPSQSPPLLKGETLELRSVSAESSINPDEETEEYGLEAIYDVTLPLEEPELEDTTSLAEPLRRLASWIASALVAASDLTTRHRSS
jgi:hypothetical protein